MTIKIIEGDLFESKAEVFVNAVNCDGIMGKGIALQFKQRYPRMFEWYWEVCRGGDLFPGQMIPWPTAEKQPSYIFNIATKNHWRNQSRWQWIDEGICDSLEVMYKMDLRTIAMPALGCGEGGLDWDVIHKAILDSFSYKVMNSGIEIHLYKPLGRRQNGREASKA